VSARKNPAAVALGRRGGKVKSEAKAAAVRANGAKGGRPWGKIAIVRDVTPNRVTVVVLCRSYEDARIKADARGYDDLHQIVRVPSDAAIGARTVFRTTTEGDEGAR
jgi:hypothetical protein